MAGGLVLDPGFESAALWERRFRERVEASGGGVPLVVAVSRPDGSVSVVKSRLLPAGVEGAEALNRRFVERQVKFLLWSRGGDTVYLAGDVELGRWVERVYSSGGERSFDRRFIGDEVYRLPLGFEVLGDVGEAPAESETSEELGGHLDGCRIGFDLGGSDRKCAAVVDGEVVFSEEVKWDPYFESDPSYHFRGIDDSLRRAAAHLPRVDAIGGSAAGVYVENEVRAGSLFRGVSAGDFERRVRRMFFELQSKWGGVPFVVVNDGEVTALAGAMETGATGVLGIAMGTSEAAGYVTRSGQITNWLNELAFAPVDYRPGAPVDEWSGDRGCGVQYLSQQAVARLAPAAGIAFPEGTGFPEQLAGVTRLAEGGDPRALGVFRTVGAYLAHAVAHYATYYEIAEVLVLGRVVSGRGGDVLLSEARSVLAEVFPGLAGSLSFRVPGEKERRHGQAIAAASLPALRAEC